MLDKMREHSRSAVIYVFFAIIIAVFVFSFGPGSGSCRSGQLSSGSFNAAEVNGQAIGLRSFEQTYGNVVRDYQQRAGGSFSDEMARAMRLKENVLDQMIDRELLAQAAEKQGIHVSDRELAESIRKIGAFQVEGKFDSQQYQLMIERQIGTTTSLFESELRRGMLAQKMVASVSASAKVSEDEVRAAFVKEKDKVNLAFVRFSPHQLKDQISPPSDEEIAAFEKANAEKIEQAYKNDSFKFHKPKRVRARHILAKVDEGAPASEVEAAQKRIDALKLQVAAPGADFAAIAKESSEDAGSKDKGGDLGTFGPGTMDAKFQEAAYALEAGQISDVVRTRFGFHLIRVEEIFAAEDKSLQEAAPELARELLIDEKARELAKTRAAAALAALKAGTPLETQFPADDESDNAPKDALQMALNMASAGRPQVTETGLFSASGEYVPQLGVSPEVARTAFALTSENPSPEQVFEVNGSQVVITLKERDRADMAQFDASKEEWTGRARAEKVNATLEGFVKALKEKASIKKNEALVDASSGGLGIEG